MTKMEKKSETAQIYRRFPGHIVPGMAYNIDGHKQIVFLKDVRVEPQKCVGEKSTVYDAYACFVRRSLRKLPLDLVANRVFAHGVSPFFNGASLHKRAMCVNLSKGGN